MVYGISAGVFSEFGDVGVGRVFLVTNPLFYAFQALVPSVATDWFEPLMSVESALFGQAAWVLCVVVLAVVASLRK